MSSQVKKKVNDEFMLWLNDKYSEFRKVKATRGNVRDYLGMKFLFDMKR